MVAAEGIEPSTSGLWVLRSNQLSYAATSSELCFDSYWCFLNENIKYYSRIVPPLNPTNILGLLDCIGRDDLPLQIIDLWWLRSNHYIGVFIDLINQPKVFVKSEWMLEWKLQKLLVSRVLSVTTQVWNGSGGRIWTYDLQVMSLTSYRTALPRDKHRLL